MNTTPQNPAEDALAALYRLAIPTAAHETGLTVEQFLAGLSACESEGFARYDADAEVVWVINQTHHQVGVLSSGDNRLKACHAQRNEVDDSYLAEQHRECYGGFMDDPIFPEEAQGAKPLASPSEGACHAPCADASKPLASTGDVNGKREQETGKGKPETETEDVTPEQETGSENPDTSHSQLAPAVRCDRRKRMSMTEEDAHLLVERHGFAAVDDAAARLFDQGVTQPTAHQLRAEIGRAHLIGAN